MKKSIHLLLIFISVFVVNVSANESDTLVMFFDKNDQEVNLENASYIIKVYEQNSNWIIEEIDIENLVDLTSGHQTGKIHTNSDQFSAFFPSGVKKVEGKLKKGKAIGIWSWWHQNNTLEKTGTFDINNLQTGTWSSWFEHGSINYEGNFKNGLKHGEWKYYHSNGNLSAIEFYKNNELLNVKHWDKKGKAIDNELIVQTLAEFPKGTKALDKFLKNNIEYSEEAFEEKIEGQVIVSFMIDKKGVARNPIIVKSLHPDLDREAIRMVKILPKFIPGTKHNRAISNYKILPITFSVPKNIKQAN